MGKTSTYPAVHDGGTVSPRMDRPFKMMCCDCGLVHKLRFKVVRLTKSYRDGRWQGKKVKGYKVIFTAWRDSRATALTRRQRKRPLLKEQS